MSCHRVVWDWVLFCCQGKSSQTQGPESEAYISENPKILPEAIKLLNTLKPSKSKKSQGTLEFSFERKNNCAPERDVI